ncbi:hypothetical protein CLV62_12583 [Dysgonomonas alginatilytica]|uniref:Uncharacterized protein n=1 Tax=Dysgonomonas alginatilytica TaxID=1605892 RepID=A0A2V3PMX8_9BACT|nr:hypothetical protein [Dysgonomonas alginatilytica]PXV61250.1 hypothetical protein CLV62_12583 [Dysgonomonas alginatilytica]
MKTKKQTNRKVKSPRMVAGTPVFDTIRPEIGEKISAISAGLDIMNDPRFKDEHFVMTEEKGVRSYTVSALSDDLFISFTINWKGATS